MSRQANNPVMTTMSILRTLVEAFIIDAWFQREVSTMQEVTLPNHVTLCLVVFCMTKSIYCYADQCYHHFDDFISPKNPPSNWFDKVMKVLGQRDVNDLKAESLRKYLHCYSASSSPTLRALLCQDVFAAVEDITCKYIHVYTGYSCPPTGQLQANWNSKVLSVRACSCCHM